MKTQDEGNPCQRSASPLGLGSPVSLSAPRIHSPPDCKLQDLPEMRPCPFSTTEPEKKRARAPQRAFKPRARPPARAQVPQTLSTTVAPGAGAGAARAPRGAARAGPASTHWAEPTLLSLLPSTLAGLASSTSCCSSVIGAAAGGHLQTSARRRPASGSSSRGRRPRGRRPSAPPRASPAPRAHPGRAAGSRPPTWTRPSGRDWPE